MWPSASASAFLVENPLKPDGSGVETAEVGGDVDRVLELVGLVVETSESESGRQTPSALLVLSQIVLVLCVDVS